MTPGSANLLLGAGTDGYQISRSVRFRPSATTTFSRLPSVTSNQKTFTFSGWVKRGVVSNTNHGILMAQSGTSNGSLITNITFTSTYALQFEVHTQSTSQIILATTTSVFRDPSAWYHVVVAIDTTQATSTDGVKIYVNNVQQTLTISNYSQNANSAYNVSTCTNYLARFWNDGGVNSYADLYLTELNFIDGQQLTPSSFGETDLTTGVWKPKRYTGTYGTNGYYLNFADNSAATAAAIGKDSSGNGFNFTPVNISLTAGHTYDSMIDTPTPYADGNSGRGNYCVLNPVNTNGVSTTAWSNGNLQFTAGSVNNWFTTTSTIAVSSGKWYWEGTPLNALETMFGLTAASYNPQNSIPAGWNTTSWAYYSGGSKYTNATATAYGASYTTNDVIGIAFDADAGTLTFYKNGASQGVAFTGIPAGSYVPHFGNTTIAGANVLVANFGQRPFAYTPPTGYKALNTQNLPEPTIKKPNVWFDATTYAGNGGTQTVSNLSFQPDLIWIKNRSAANHAIVDSVRPSGYALYPNLTDAEANNSSLFTGISGNSFSLAGGNPTYNAANNYISWLWKKGATPGFDIVTYTGDGTTGRAISHSLGVAPKMIITKMRSSAIASWNCWHTGINTNQVIYLNGTSAAATPGSGINWNPTSTTFSVDPDGGYGSNASGVTQVAYLFAEVAGFSRIATYIGNGSADGPIINCGFKPRFVLLKRSTTSGESWGMFDSARNQFNETNASLYANLTNAEGTGAPIDFLSNGFKIRTTNALCNSSSATYIFMAFAENPFKYALAR